MYDLQTSYKPFVYSIKLKLEFSILNRLVELATRGGSKRSSTYTSSRGDSNLQLDIMYDKVYREKAVNLRNNVYIQLETASEEEVKAGSQAVILITEISVQRNIISVKYNSNGNLGNLNIKVKVRILRSLRSFSERNVIKVSY